MIYSNHAGTMSESFAIGKRGVKLLQGISAPTSELKAPIGSLYLKKSGGTVRVYQLVALETWEPLLVAGSIPFLLAQNDENIPNGKSISAVGPLQFSPSTGTLSLSNNPTFSGVGGIGLPSGSTVQRPISPSVGQTRFNTTIGSIETYTGSVWKSSGVSIYRTSFTNDSLAAGNLTITHSIGEQFVQITVIDNNNRVISPDEVEMISTTQSIISLSSFGNLVGNWRVVVTG